MKKSIWLILLILMFSLISCKYQTEKKFVIDISKTKNLEKTINKYDYILSDYFKDTLSGNYNKKEFIDFTKKFLKNKDNHLKKYGLLKTYKESTDFYSKNKYLEITVVNSQDEILFLFKKKKDDYVLYFIGTSNKN